MTTLPQSATPAPAAAPASASDVSAAAAPKVAAKVAAKVMPKATAKPAAKKAAAPAKAPVKTPAKVAAQPARPSTSKALAKAVPPPQPLAKSTKAAKAVQVVAATKTMPKVAVALDAVAKPKKPKLVRDSFTIPKNEYEAIATLKARALKQGLSIKKSELLRAGLMTLAFMSDAAFAKAVADVPTLKTGRPATSKATDKKGK